MIVVNIFCYSSKALKPFSAIRKEQYFAGFRRINGTSDINDQISNRKDFLWIYILSVEVKPHPLSPSPFRECVTISVLVAAPPLAGRNRGVEFYGLTQPEGLVEKVTFWGGINSRPYGRQLLIIHRAGFILPFGPETSGSKERDSP